MPIRKKAIDFGDDLAEYCLALLRHWRPIVSGAVLGLASYVYGLAENKAIPLKVYLLVLLGAALVAGFLAWRDEYQKGLVATARIKELETRPELARPTETAEEQYWRLKTQAETPELAMKILTGYVNPTVKSEPGPYLAIEYVSEWETYTSESDHEEYTDLVEYLKFTNASSEVIRNIRVEPFKIWGVELSTEPVPTLIHGESIQKRVRRLDDLLKKANVGLRAFNKVPVGVLLTATYFGLRDDNEPIRGRHALIYDRGDIRVEPLIGNAPSDWLDASGVITAQDEIIDE